MTLPLVVDPPARAGTPPPPAPLTLADTGLRADQASELLLKTLVGGELSGTNLSDRLALPYSILESLIEHARVEKLVEVRGSAGAGTAGYRYVLTDLGRDRASQFLELSRYVGPAPVPLSQYINYMRALMGSRGFLDRDRLSGGFTHLIVGPDMLEELGPAVNSNKSLFIYGPPGNGKTVVAEGIGRALGGEMYIPHAVDIDGQIITMFDVVSHVRIEGPSPGQSLIAGTGHDRRWERIRRPVVTVGGELTLDMLDLTFNPISRFYEAPIQLKANGGVFVVDDFGRQRIPARDLLNRWIVPLESRVDYLTLHTGRKFEVPFDVLVVFATNLKPETLADEAFLRRIPYKIYARNPSVDEFTRIWELNCRRKSLTFEPKVIDYLLRKYYQPRGLQLRACHPRDLIEQVVDRCRFEGRPPAISRELLDAACASYFIDEQASERAAAEGMR
jgi:hypothetical protein